MKLTSAKNRGHILRRIYRRTSYSVHSGGCKWGKVGLLRLLVIIHGSRDLILVRPYFVQPMLFTRRSHTGPNGRSRAARRNARAYITSSWLIIQCSNYSSLRRQWFEPRSLQQANSSFVSDYLAVRRAPTDAQQPSRYTACTALALALALVTLFVVPPYCRRTDLDLYECVSQDG
jgi:hypothetical protein